MSMEFVWDEAKNKKNLRNHGLDFRDSPEVFESKSIIVEDTRYDYGEIRYNLFGMLQDLVVVVTLQKEKRKLE